MFELLHVNIDPKPHRVGSIRVRYFDIEIVCDICLYQQKKLWIRMPEMWKDKQTKVTIAHWASDEASTRFQQEILVKLFERIGLTVEKAVELMKKKKGDNNKKNK